MSNAAKGVINLVLENASTPGEQVLLNNAAVAASMSLTSQPPISPATGSRLLIYVQGNTTAGTISIAGTAVGGSNITEPTITVPVPTQSGQSGFIMKFEYLTKNVFATVNANGITTTGMAGGTITVQAVQGTKYMIPGTMKVKAKYDKYSPNEHRNLLDRDSKVLQLIKKVALDELSTQLYPNESLWLFYMMCGSAPTVSTLPATPTVLLSATAVAASMSLTTQPLAPAQNLQIIVTGASAGGTISIAGTDQYGNSASETLSPSGNGTYYSSKCYSAVNANGITTTGLTGGSIAVNGAYAYVYTGTPQDTRLSAVLEMFTGTDSFAMPYTMIDETTVEYGTEKDVKITAKGIAQDRLVIGARTATSLSTSYASSLAQPTGIPIMGWQTAVYLDTSVASVPTNSFGDLLEAKFTFKNPTKGAWTSTNTQNYNRIWQGKRETDLEGKIDLQNVLQLEQYRQNLVQYMTFQFIGTPVGGGNNVLWQLTFPMRYEEFDPESEPSSDHVEVNFKSKAEYDPNLGGAYKLTVINQVPPTYTA